MSNPIFIEYYPHERCSCYKIRNPWTQYGEEKIVLCPVREGLDVARNLAVGALVQKMIKALSEDIP